MYITSNVYPTCTIFPLLNTWTSIYFGDLLHVYSAFIRGWHLINIQLLLLTHAFLFLTPTRTHGLPVREVKCSEKPSHLSGAHNEKECTTLNTAHEPTFRQKST